MEFLRPRSLSEALAARAEFPGALPIAGGTDVMVEINFDKRRPTALLDLTGVPELTGWERDNGLLRVGSGVTCMQMGGELADFLPSLAMAARTVGGPQIRNRATIGGNLGSASPAGDVHPVLLAANATVEAASVRGIRLIPADAFFLGPKRNALAADELVTAVLVAPAPGPQQFAKVGTRNAMVIAVCSFALELRPPGTAGGAADTGASGTGAVGTGIGSAGPTPLRATAAEGFLAGELADSGLWESRAPLPGAVMRRFGELAAAAARPIDDVRGSAAYRRRALSVLARRALAWAWDSYREETHGCG
jgi:CO/xanthine dehydrogenase FAD-binding subunit